ncbi:MAG: NB-ARC domain-containing protein, partial [Bacteroidota bacterium]
MFGIPFSPNMQTNPNFFTQLRDLITHNDLPTALEQLRNLLANSPLLKQAINQSGRFQDIQDKIHAGTVTREEGEVAQNKIRAAVLDLLTMIERQVGADGTQPEVPEMQAEFERALISIQNSKNINTGTATAGRDFHFGDKTENHYHYGDRKIPRALTAQPFFPEVFLGREKELDYIYNNFFSHKENLLLLVNGDGGVGKTSLASRYYHAHAHAGAYAHRAWLLSEKNIVNAMLQLANPLDVKFDERAGPIERLEVLLPALAELNAPCLLVIDNANELEDLDATYQYLRRLTNFHLLLTTRVTNFEQAETYRIEGLPYDKALELFQKYYPKFQPGEEDLFRHIRDAVAGNTLVIELLAKTLAQTNRLKTRYSLADLLQDLQGKGVLQLTQSAPVRTDYQGKGRMRHETPSAIIEAMYDLSELSAEERRLLSNFA